MKSTLLASTIVFAAACVLAVPVDRPTNGAPPSKDPVKKEIASEPEAIHYQYVHFGLREKITPRLIVRNKGDELAYPTFWDPRRRTTKRSHEAHIGHTEQAQSLRDGAG